MLKSQRTALFLLVWYALFLGSAWASVLIKPDIRQAVCTVGGAIQWVDADGANGDVQASSGMDCPLCATGFAPWPDTGFNYFPDSPLPHALLPHVTAHIAWATAPPLPSRGPPAL